MANPEHEKAFKKGVDSWNQYRQQNIDKELDLAFIEVPGINLEGINFSNTILEGADLGEAHLVKANLSMANLEGANLAGSNLFGSKLYAANLREATLDGCNLEGALMQEASMPEASFIGARLRGADLSSTEMIMSYGDNADFSPGTRIYPKVQMDVPTNLSKAKLWGARLPASNFTEANLEEAELTQINLCEADLRGTKLANADLRKAYLVEANCWGADFSGADLTDAHLIGAKLLNCNFSKATLANCLVYGISAWDLQLEGTIQSDLVISPPNQSKITVDNLEIAQFIHLLVNNQKIRGVIDTITAKAVLILGRFIEERKIVLDSLRSALRERDFVPIIFDFDKPKSQDFTETIKTLAGLCRFVIVDITNPKSSPLELQAAVPDYMIPFVPIQDQSEEPFSMFLDLQAKYDWVLDVLMYDNVDNLIKVLEPAILVPALEKSAELMARKAQAIKKRDIADYL